MWPPASADLNPIHFSRLTLKAKFSYVAHPSVDVLKISLLRDWVKISQETLRVTVGNFKQRIKLLVESKGHHI